MASSPSSPIKSLVVSMNNHPYNSLSKKLRVDEEFDCVKVEISDLENASVNQTTRSLMKCKKQILIPFRKLLCLIGWRPFGADSSRRSSLFLRIINIIYPICILMLLVFNYAYEIINCQGKLNVITDTQTLRTIITTTTAAFTSTIQNRSIETWATLRPGIILSTKPSVTSLHDHAECGHIFTTYILPDVFHFLSFIIGFIHFRVTEGEPLYSLMEKVFIHADQNMNTLSPNRAIRRLKLFMLIASLWMLISVATHAFANSMNDFSHTLIFGDENLFFDQGTPIRYVLFAIDIMCLLISHCILIAVVMNYVCYCEMIVFYGKAIRTKLEEKSLELQEAMKRILDLGVSISQMNSSASRMMSVLLIFFLQRTILGTLLLVLNRIFLINMWIYRSMYTLVWLTLLIFCLGEAARVTSKCDKFHRIAISMRVYGYHNSNQRELDGFLLFLSEASLRAKLFGLTVRPGKIIFIGILALLVFVVLFQTSIVSSENFFF